MLSERFNYELEQNHLVPYSEQHMRPMILGDSWHKWRIRRDHYHGMGMNTGGFIPHCIRTNHCEEFEARNQWSSDWTEFTRKVCNFDVRVFDLTGFVADTVIKRSIMLGGLYNLLQEHS